MTATETQETGYYVNITNFQLDKLHKLSDNIHRVIHYKYTGANMMSLSLEFKKLMEEIENGK